LIVFRLTRAGIEFTIYRT